MSAPSAPPVDSLVTADPYARRAQMFPTLTAAQVRRVAAFGHERTFDDGAIAFEQGQENAPFFVVLAGELEVVHPSGANEESVVTHGPGQFTGEVNLIAGRRSLVRGRAKGQARVIEVENKRLRALVQTDADLSEILMRAFILRRMGLLASRQGDAVLVGSRHSAGTLRLQEFLGRNGHPFAYVDVDVDEHVQALLDTFHVRVDEVPVLLCRGERVLKNPSNEEVAECLGFSAILDADAVRDVVVIGAGPAGLAAAVYAGSEGLDVLVLETNAPGGQAGSSSKIENYLGFPTGISGGALAARALTQAEKFGAEVAIARTAHKLECGKRPYTITLSDGSTVRARAVVIAAGARYRKPRVEHLERYEGLGVYYGATYVESQRCGQDEVIIVGGGNSAGQAAVFLSQTASKVHILVRGAGLSETMSRYLIRRIEETPNIQLHVRTEIERLEGDEGLERVTWRDAARDERQTVDVRHVFLMTGAEPNTGWLEGCVRLDEKGFIVTGPDLRPDALHEVQWPLTRPPASLETSRPGVFAVGDVRSKSVKRVASAVGEGSVCIQMVYATLNELRLGRGRATAPLLGRAPSIRRRADVSTTRNGERSVRPGSLPGVARTSAPTKHAVGQSRPSRYISGARRTRAA